MSEAESGESALPPSPDGIVSTATGRLRRVAVWAAVGTAVAAGIAATVPLAAAGATPSRFTDGVPEIGALFTLTPGGALAQHFCTGSVVDSRAGDLVLTAAHCLENQAPDRLAFVPEYHAGAAPFGVWRVVRTAVDRRWRRQSNPDDDFAFLVVRRPGETAPIESLTGANRLGIGVGPGKTLHVLGYPDGHRRPISCVSKLRLLSRTQLQFDCGGFADGTSGSPLLADVNPRTGTGVVAGVIGGFELGGDTPSVSYAARFERNMTRLFQYASRLATSPPPSAPASRESPHSSTTSSTTSSTVPTRR